MDPGIAPELRQRWQVPNFQRTLWLGKRSAYCLVIPVVNEGPRIASLLERMLALGLQDSVDVLIVDGGSTDGSINATDLPGKGIRGLLTTARAGLSSQLRCAYAFALDQGYEGIVTIDGNDKDDPAAIPKFVASMAEGFDFVQASRYIAGGLAENTPLVRDFAIRYIHAPLLALFSGFRWTDTTQGYRAYSRRILLDERVAPFRDVFVRYELLPYMSYRVPRLGYRCVELPTIRRYPIGAVPTKISSVRGNIAVFSALIRACLGGYNAP